MKKSPTRTATHIDHKKTIVSRETMKALEAQAGCPERELLERACQGMYTYLLKKYWLDKSSQLGFVCGEGNNGADALRLGQIFYENGYHNLRFVVVESGEHRLSPLNAEFRKSWQNTKSVTVSFCTWPERLGSTSGGLAGGSQAAKKCLQGCALIFDGVFGFGFRPPLKKEIAELFSLLNALPCLRVAIDIPSGIIANTGGAASQKSCFMAHETLAIGAFKWGHFLNEGSVASGKLAWIDLALPENTDVDSFGQLIDQESFRKNLMLRDPLANKGNFGRLLIVGGTQNMLGALNLAARAALRVGVGYVYAVMPEKQSVRPAGLPDEVQWLPAQDLLKGFRTQFSSVLIGPGLGTSDAGLELRDWCLKNMAGGVIDADGLRGLDIETLSDNWILTPHPKEFLRLWQENAVGKNGALSSVAAINLDRVEHLQKFLQKTQATIVLKGRFTLVGKAKQPIRCIHSGNVALAKAGTGDVLAGMIAGFHSQGCSVDLAAELGAYLHGHIADEWVQSHSNASLIPSDLILGISRALLQTC